MFVTREEEDLASPLGEFDENLRRDRRAAVVEVHENVVPDERRLHAVLLEGDDERESNRDKEEFASSARQRRHFERFAVRRVDEERVFS